MAFKGPFKTKPVCNSMIYGHQKFDHKMYCHLPFHLSSGTNCWDKPKLLVAGRCPARRSGIRALCPTVCCHPGFCGDCSIHSHGLESAETQSCRRHGGSPPYRRHGSGRMALHGPAHHVVDISCTVGCVTTAQTIN